MPPASCSNWKAEGVKADPQGFFLLVAHWTYSHREIRDSEAGLTQQRTSENKRNIWLQ